MEPIEDRVLRELKTKINEALNKRLNRDEPSHFWSLLTLASSLDIRWRRTDFVFKSVEEFVTAINSFETSIGVTPLASSYVTASSEVTQQMQQQQSKKSKFSNLFAEMLAPASEGDTVQLDGSSKLQQELASFLSLPPLSEAELANADRFDLLKWWEDRKLIYPLLSSISKKLFSILASAATCESLFSTAGNVITGLRSSLSPLNVDMLLFLFINTPESFYAIPK